MYFLYQRLIFELRAEVSYLKTINESNNAFLKDEIIFLKDELHGRNRILAEKSSCQILRDQSENMSILNVIVHKNGTKLVDQVKDDFIKLKNIYKQENIDFVDDTDLKESCRGVTQLSLDNKGKGCFFYCNQFILKNNSFYQLSKQCNYVLMY